MRGLVGSDVAAVAPIIADGISGWRTGQVSKIYSTIWCCEDRLNPP